MRLLRFALTAALAFVLALSTVSAQSVTGGGDFGIQGALGAGAGLPVFNANFSSNPASLPGVTSPTNYQWLSVDTNDSTALQAVHQGIISLNGVANFINLSTSTGASSIGLTLPLLGTTSSSTTSPGWSFEFVWKPLGEQNTWAKLADFGNGASSGYYPSSNDDWTFGFDGNDQTEFLLETYNAGPGSGLPAMTPNFTHGWTELQALVLGQWYHMVVVQMPQGALGGANWNVYFNGQLFNYAYPLNGGQPLTTSYLQGANYPQPNPRPQAYLGKSNWMDPLLQCEIDAVRIYDYALSSAQVTALAALYSSTTPAPSTPLNPTTYPAAGSQAASFATFQPNTGEAAIATTLAFGFQPVFNAPFSANPMSLVGGQTGYTWMQQDAADAAGVQALHQGILLLNGSTSSFVDLVQVTGPQSIGQTLPILFGASSGSGTTYGWSVDLVIKPLAMQTWSKLFDLGTGAYIDSFYMGWVSNSNQWEAANYISTTNALAQAASGSPTMSSAYITNITPFLNTPTIGAWYHLAWVLQPASTDTTYATASASVKATWAVYVNGQAVFTGFAGNMPLPLFRHVSYLGRSDWFQEGAGDAMLQAEYDAFRIWDRALTATQVSQLAGVYGLNSSAANASTTGSVTSGGDFGIQGALGAGAKLPVFNANFSVNPASLPGVTAPTNYQWLSVDTADSTALQAVHQGIISLNGVANFINLSTSTGASSIGLTLPLLGTTSSSTTSPGWSFEFVWKPLGEQNTWAKLADFGNGASSGYYPSSNDDWTFGFDGNDQTEFLLETYNAGPGSGLPAMTPNFTHGWTELQALVLGQWYHMVVVQMPQGALGGANWNVYFNGQLFNYAYPLNGGQPLTTSYLQGANYPQPNPRPQAYLGKSNWMDPLLQCEIDAVRIYDYALSSAQVTALAALYSSTTPAPSTPLNPTTYPAAGSQAASFATFQPNTGEAAIATTLAFGFQPVFNAPFSANPMSLVGGQTGYTWMQQDAADAAGVQALHQGILLLNGSTSSFVDLVQVTGPQSIGQTLPILFGASSGSGTTYGWSVDLVIKPLAMQTWSKLFDLGTGAYIDSFYMGWVSNSNQWEAANYISTTNALAQAASGSPTMSSAYITNITPFLNTPTIGAWYHLAWVLQPASTDTTYATASASVKATWAVYVNGQAVFTGFAGNMPLPLFRHVSYLGRSDWFQEGAGDAMLQAEYDAFRIWDRALTATQVSQLAGVYGLNSSAANASTTGSVTSGGDFGIQGALGAGAKLPVFNANFSVNPASLPGVTAPTNYQWLSVDTADSTALQAVHQGIISLNGVANFINLSTSTGASSIGLTLPLLGTTSSSTTSPGWSFEFVWKPLGEQNTWAKLADFGNGASSGYYPSSNDDWTFGFDGNDQTEFLLETYNAGPGSGLPAMTPNFTHGWTELQALVLGQWYHMVVVQMPQGALGGANWNVYFNGQLFNYAYPLNGGQPLTTSYLQGANYPQPNPRPQAYLGKSNWMDPLLQCEIDAVRIYDYALSSAQVTALAALYSSTTPAPSTPLNPTTYPAAGSQAASFATFQPNTGEAAIATTLAFGFQPVFNAPFSANPMSLVGGQTGYTWMQQDAADAAGVQALHQGILLLNGSTSSFVDLVQVTGPQSIGQTLPILFGASSGSGTTYGWSVDLVIKPLAMQTWSKLFDLGTGAYIDSFYMGWVSNSNQWEAANYISTTNALAQAASGSPTMSSAYITNITPFLNTPTIGAWYHLAWVLQPASTDTTYATASASVKATWAVYVNGQAVFTGFAGNMPLPLFRHVSYLGRSDWFQEGAGDAMLQAEYDAFRIWDRALTATQVSQLAGVYGLNSSAANASTTGSVTSGGDFGIQGALGAGAKLPVFNANFSVNPASLPGVTAPTNYQWLSVDTADSTALQAVHQGIISLNGVANFINLSTSTGASSIGLTLPLLGTTSSSTTSPGWSFEFVWKPLGEQNTWAKLADFGNGASSGYYPSSNDDWTFGFDGNDQTEFLLETYNAGPGSGLPAMTPNFTHGWTELQALVLGQWYHMVVVQMPQGALGGANWNVYFNGQLFNYAYPLNGGQPLTTSYLQGANYPQPNPRPQAYLGKSNWMDPLLQCEIDAVRIYDYALSSAQVTALAALYSSTTPAPSTPLNPTTYPAAGSQAASFATFQPNTGEAAIATTLAFGFQPVFNAPFSANPMSLVGGQTGYTWMQQDAADAAGVQALHQGILLLNGSTSSFVDLVQVTGPQSIGQTLPILFGASSGSGTTYGWSVDLVIKPLAMQTWSKLFDLGTGAYIDSFYMGWVSNSNQWEAANYISTTNALAQAASGSPTMSSAYITNITPFLNTPTIGAWYHLAWVLQPASTDTTYATASASVKATWAVYVNGQAVFTGFAGNMPLPLFRHVSYLGRSDWFQEGAGDAMLQAEYDAFRIWDRALTATQVSQLAGVYGLNSSAANASTTGSVTSGGDFGIQGALGAGAKLPVFNANFSVNPASLPGVTAPTNYQWLSVDTADSTALQAVHQGIISLNGVANFINLSTSTGASSIGLTLPLLGTTSSSTTSPGWSFEFVWKPLGEQNTWAKLADFGNGASSGYYPSSNDDWTFGFDGNDQTEFLLETYNAGPGSGLPAMTPNFTHGWTELQALVLGQWYHMVVVQMPQGALGGANWNVYFNGQLFNYAYPLNGGQPLTTSYLQGANYPQPNPRPQAYLGKSNWMDPLLQCEIDAVRIYDYALSSAQVTALAALYSSTTPAPSTPLNPTTYPAAGSQAASFATFQPNTGEAAIATTLAFGFQPVFNAPFSANPMSLVGGQTGYTWMQQDAADAAGVQALHQGILLLNGSTSSFVDLVQVTGPQSIGQTLPILFGASSGSGTTYGWSVDLVIKPLAMQTWSKLFDLGTGAYIDSFYMGWVSNSNQWEAANYISTTNALAQAASGSPTMSSAYITNITPFLNTPTIGAWYHLAWVLQPASTDTTYATASASVKATWAVYVNGQAVFTGFAGNMPLPLFRHVSYLGRSDWFQEGAGDAMLQAEYDAFRIWDRALTATQVSQLAGVYGLNSSAANASTTGSVTSGGDFGIQGALGAGAKLPVFNANFSVNPASLPGVTAPTNYQWLSVDTADSTALQAVHQGIISLNGVANFINLSTSTGASSIGLTLPLLGTTSSSTTSPGWSFEFVWKPLGEQNTWAKLADFGNGASSGYYPSSNDDWTFGFDGNDQTEFLLETYNAGPGSGLPAMTPNFTHGWTELQALVLGQWYHMVVVQMPQGALGGANWNVYFNGQLFNYAYPLNGGQPLTTSYLQGANYPQPNPRPQAYLGKSNWMDPLLQCEIDAVRIYDYALSSAQVTALAALYSSTTPAPSTPLNPTTYPAAGSQAASFATFQPNTGEAAIATTLAFGFQPVFNAPFSANPMSLVGGQTGYTWMQQDAADAAGVQALHQGILLLNGSTSSFVDLVQVTGPQSIGQTLPILFGASSGSGTTYGWSVDLVIKPLAMQTWSKLFDLGTGAYIDSFYMGWVSNSNQWEAANYISTTNALAQAASGSPTMSSAYITNITPFLNTPTIGAWYHLAWVLQPASTDTTYATASASVKATWAVYVNGQAVFTGFAGNMPLPLFRHVSYLGRSDWFQEGAGDAMLQAEYDAFRIWDRALTATQVSQLAGVYGLNNATAASGSAAPAASTGGARAQPTSAPASPLPPTSAPQLVVTSPAAAPSITSAAAPPSVGGGGGGSGLSGGAIAGIVIGSVVGALLLLGLLLCVFFGASRSKDVPLTPRKTRGYDSQQDTSRVGGASTMEEPSHDASHEGNTEEVEMGEVHT